MIKKHPNKTQIKPPLKEIQPMILIELFFNFPIALRAMTENKKIIQSRKKS